ncbi:unnamed protein product [Lathyrus oleraceus]|uniref:Transcription factor gte6 n=1 Tax=Pisum sativum TaxID=3888 RepID=A0A9D5AUC3_PEA|nr:transcription factor GTE1-like [Pisum sativum]KAI5419094.1 Transcription factor gte6 [Pisum sativum]
MELHPRVDDDHFEGFRHSFDEIHTEVDKLEKQVIEVERHYESAGNVQGSNSKGVSVVKEKGRGKSLVGTKKLLQDAPRMETAAAKRMQELMRQFSTILRQITQHKWAWPFLEPVDVEGLGLHDYYEIIDKPMDFGTIKNKMEAKDDTGYKNVREIYADVRLIFKNAMKYNDEKHDVHVMAKTLLEKFEDKWLQLLPKVAEEEKREIEEEAQTQLDNQHAQEMTYAKIAKDLASELDEVDLRLTKLKEMVIQNCRKLSTGERKKLVTALAKLSPENLQRALGIVAENNPSFESTQVEVVLDLDAQSDYTLWRLQHFVKGALEDQPKICGGTTIDIDTEEKKTNSRKRREFCDALVNNLTKTRKLSNL